MGEQRLQLDADQEVREVVHLERQFVAVRGDDALGMDGPGVGPRTCMTTSASARASSIAAASPIPLLAPVMSTRLPAMWLMPIRSVRGITRDRAGHAVAAAAAFPKLGTLDLDDFDAGVA